MNSIATILEQYLTFAAMNALQRHRPILMPPRPMRSGAFDLLLNSTPQFFFTQTDSDNTQETAHVPHTLPLMVRDLMSATEFVTGAPGSQCSICFETNHKKLCRKLKDCKHSFHVECIDHWLAGHRSCPLCRHVI